ncbi:MAG: hypothetical protein ACXAC5_03350 [Promethearchaeota archaeon]|jgi:hypothetical protein
MKVKVFHNLTLKVEFEDVIETGDLSVAEFYEQQPLELSNKHLSDAIIVHDEILAVDVAG